MADSFRPALSMCVCLIQWLKLKCQLDAWNRAHRLQGTGNSALGRQGNHDENTPQGKWPNVTAGPGLEALPKIWPHCKSAYDSNSRPRLSPLASIESRAKSFLRLIEFKRMKPLNRFVVERRRIQVKQCPFAAMMEQEATSPATAPTRPWG